MRPMRMPPAARRRLLPLTVLAVAGSLALAPAALAAPAAKAPKTVTFTGTETPNPNGGHSDETGSKRTISFKLSGNTISKLTIGAGTATCQGLDDSADNPVAPFTVKTKQLTFPNLSLNHGTFPYHGGLTVNAEFVRPGGGGPFKFSPNSLFDEAGYTVDLIMLSNSKRTVFGSKIDGLQELGVEAVFHMNQAGQVSEFNHIRCTFGGNISLKIKK
jgi:hypothetical protein